MCLDLLLFFFKPLSLVLFPKEDRFKIKCLISKVPVRKSEADSQVFLILSKSYCATPAIR